MRLLHSFILSACLLLLVIVLHILQNRYYTEESSLVTVSLEKIKKDNGNDQKQTAIPMIFHNSIKKENLGYKHWTGTYYPTTFALYINDILLLPNEKTTINVIDTSIKVRIDYSFINNKRTGAIMATYTIDSTFPIHECTFTTWTENERLLISGATYIAHESVNFDKKATNIICYQ